MDGLGNEYLDFGGNDLAKAWPFPDPIAVGWLTLRTTVSLVVDMRCYKHTKKGVWKTECVSSQSWVVFQQKFEKSKNAKVGSSFDLDLS